MLAANKKFPKIFLSLWLVLAVNSTLAANNPALDWLMRITDAPQMNSYSGTFVYLHDSQIETMHVSHLVEAGMVKERLYSLNGEAREIIRDEERVWCYLPDQKTGVHEYRQNVDNSFPSILPKNLENLANHYNIELGGQERIADRMTQHIKIHPKDEYRYGYDLWADEGTGLLLRADLLNVNNEPIEQYMFANVAIGGPLFEKDLLPVHAKSEFTWFKDADEVSEASQSAVDSKWGVSDLPDGFSLSRHMKRMSAMRQQWVEHLVFSDGLAAVSVFISMDKGKSAKSMEGSGSMGAVHAFGTMVDDHLVTVVGEVPEATVKLIGQAVAKTN